MVLCPTGAVPAAEVAPSFDRPSPHPIASIRTQLSTRRKGYDQLSAGCHVTGLCISQIDRLFEETFRALGTSGFSYRIEVIVDSNCNPIDLHDALCRSLTI